MASYLGSWFAIQSWNSPDRSLFTTLVTQEKPSASPDSISSS